MKPIALFVALVLSSSAISQSIMEDLSNNRMVGILTYGEADKSTSTTHELHGASNSVKIVRLDDLCTIVINPIDEDDNNGVMTITGLNGHCDIFTASPNIPPCSAKLPVTVWKTVRMITGTCVDGRYAIVEVYDQK